MTQLLCPFFRGKPNGVEYMDGLDAVGAICETISRKGEKMALKERGIQEWQQSKSSILVLSTPDCPISEIESSLNKHMRKEVLEACVQSGFSEVWFADHTKTEAFGSVELFGLFPEEFWGHHPNLPYGKPYG
jgi:hypothetical protein